MSDPRSSKPPRLAGALLPVCSRSCDSQPAGSFCGSSAWLEETKFPSRSNKLMRLKTGSSASIRAARLWFGLKLPAPLSAWSALFTIPNDECQIERSAIGNIFRQARATHVARFQRLRLVFRVGQYSCPAGQPCVLESS